MLNFEIADDPHYAGFEFQGFSDPEHGDGILVFLNRRRDGKIDLYLERGLRIDPGNYTVGNGIGEWVETDFEVAALDVSDRGVTAQVRFTDLAGRAVEVSAGDETRGWSPQGLPPLMTMVTRVASVFRTWPTTYRWTATITDPDKPTMTSRWERTGGDRGESYRAMTRSR
ncbi:MAG TPA: hypothetical protein VLG28_00895 [Acidimicrobiia bacterium]|nr:hypothetical protein [Acidimicrobiia bacterium]